MPSRSRVSEDDSDDSEWPGERGIGGQREGIGLGLAPAVVVVVTVGVAVRGWRQRGGERFLVSTNLEGPLFSFLFFLETDSGCSQFFFASPCLLENSFCSLSAGSADGRHCAMCVTPSPSLVPISACPPRSLRLYRHPRCLHAPTRHPSSHQRLNHLAGVS